MSCAAYGVTTGWEVAVRDPARLEAVARSGLAGSGPEDAFDRLIELAVEVVGVRRGCITFVDAVRTTAKSAIGFPEGTLLLAPVERSFCRYVVGFAAPLVVDDSRSDPRTRGDPAIDAFAAVTWAGYPFEDGDGAILGTFCLMDSCPHEWTGRDLHAISVLAKAASTEIALSRSRAELTRIREELDALRAAGDRDRAASAAHLHGL